MYDRLTVLRKSRFLCVLDVVFFFSSRRRHTRYWRDWSSDVCSSDLLLPGFVELEVVGEELPGGDGRARQQRALDAAEPAHQLGGVPAGNAVRDEKVRSEECGVGEERRSLWSPYH